MKEQDKISVKDPNEKEISNLHYKEFKLIVIKMLTKLRRGMDWHSENLSKDRKHKKVQNRSYRPEEHNDWTEKYTSSFNRRLDEIEKWMNQWPGRQGNGNQSSEKKKDWKKWR